MISLVRFCERINKADADTFLNEAKYAHFAGFIEWVFNNSNIKSFSSQPGMGSNSSCIIEWPQANRSIWPSHARSAV